MQNHVVASTVPGFPAVCISNEDWKVIMNQTCAASNDETLHGTAASAAHFINSSTHNQMFSLIKAQQTSLNSAHLELHDERY